MTSDAQKAADQLGSLLQPVLTLYAVVDGAAGDSKEAQQHVGAAL